MDARRLAEVLGAMGVSPETAESATALLREDRLGITVAAFWVANESMLTAAQRSTYLAPLRAFVAAHGGDDIYDVTPDDLERFCALREKDGRDRGHSGTYQREHALRGLRWFFGRAIKARLISNNPGLEVALPERDEDGRRALLQPELAAFARVVHLSSNDVALDDLIFQTLRETACRRNALIEIRGEQIRSTSLGHSIVLTEKNNRRPQIPISDHLLVGLCRLATQRGVSLHDKHSQLFRYKDGTPLTDRRFDNIFTRVRRSEPWRTLRVTAHWIRYTTLEDVEILTSERVAKAYAGHRPSGVIQKYTWAQMQELHDVHARLFGSPNSPIADALIRRAA